MEGCSGVVIKDFLNASTSSIHETKSGQAAWLSSLTAVPDLLKEECVDMATLPSYDIMTAQQEYPTMARVLHLMQNQKASNLPGKTEGAGVTTTAFT